MADSKHPLAGGLFLVVAVGLIGFGAYSGIKAGSHGTQAGAEGASPSALPDLNTRLVEAIRMGQAGDVEGAATRLRLIVREHPNNLDAIYNLGVALIGTGELAAAEAQFQRVLELAPGDGDALAELAGLRKDQGDLDAAFAYLNQIPSRDEKLRQRLLEDPLWADLDEDERMKALMSKHGISKRGPEDSPPSGEPIR